MDNHKIIQQLEYLRFKMVVTSQEIMSLKDKKVHIHANQLLEAADMVQEWIESIRES